MTLNHVRQALRLIRHRPGSSAAVIITLALAIAANSTLFTLVNAALLAPLPVRDPGSLVNIYTSQANGAGYGGLSYPDYRDLRESGGVFQDALGYSGVMVTVSGDARSEVAFGEIVTPSYFSMLGVQPALGRGFHPEGAGPEPDASVVIGDRFWRRRFGSDPGVIGRGLTLNGRPYTIVGVAPAGFSGLLFKAIAAEVWLPVSAMGRVRTDQRENRGERWMFVKARLPAGRSVDEAAAAARVVSSRLERAHPATNTGRAFRVLATSDVLVHPEGDRAIVPAALGVMLAGGLVLLVACANLAGVMLARGLPRRPEIAIRLAIGAGRRQIVSQFLTEGLVLAALGGAGGLLLARWCAGALAAWRPELPVPIALNPAIDWRVATFTLAVTAAATLLFALLPALRASRTPAAGALASPAVRRRRAFGLRDALLVPQLAIALALVAVAGLFARSLSAADAVDPGFTADRRAFVSLNLAMSAYDDDRARRFYESLRHGLEQRGSVTHVALSDRLPLDMYGNRSAAIAVGDRFESEWTVQTGHAGRGYFETLGIPIVRGRGFGVEDEHPAARTVIVSAEAARRLWPDRDAIGQRVRFAPDGPPSEVVGIAGDVKVQTLGEAPSPFIYQPLSTGYAGLLRVIVRTRGDAESAVDQLRADVRALDPGVAVFEARSMGDYMRIMLYPYRLAAAVGAVLGFLTLVLAGIGLYGVLACSVSERLRELAIRIALGAAPAAIIRTSTAEALRAAAFGIGIGTVLTLIAGRLVARVLFGTSPADPVTLGATGVALLVVMLLSSAGPVRRALRLAPMSILRQ